MVHHLLIVSGKDRPGIVSAVSGLLASQNINLEDLRMSILEGQFAMMVIVCIPRKSAQEVLDQKLKVLEKRWRLTVFQCDVGGLSGLKKSKKKQSDNAEEQTFLVRVLGRDKTGIVAGVSRILAQYGFNISDLQCRILGVGARALYAMVLECSAPPRARVAGLKKSLARLAQKLDIEVTLQKSNRVQL